MHTQNNQTIDQTNPKYQNLELITKIEEMFTVNNQNVDQFHLKPKRIPKITKLLTNLELITKMFNKL